MYLLCTTQADPKIRMTTQNPSRKPLSASRARSCPVSFGVKGLKDDVMNSNKLLFIEITRLHDCSSRPLPHLHTAVILCSYHLK